MTGENADAMPWRSLDEADLPAVAELAAVCLTADGGQPYAADSGFLRGWYFGGALSRGLFDGGSLVCATSMRRAVPDSAAALGATASTTGLVHPSWRRRGIGGHAFGWAREQAGGALCAHTEMLTDGANALYLSRGMSQVFAEEVMRLPASVPAPAAAAPGGGLVLSEWGQADPARFHAVYTASFRERPGFPAESLARWTEWVTDDEDFRPEWALLATLDGADAGFVIGDAGGWIAKLGVLPAARGRGLGAYLMAEAIHRMRSGGEMVITLNVNVNNPNAIALYRRLGFAHAGRRARYVQA
jgi:ribosomal protein S18 acetylase RimI-like enzyme